MVIKRSDITKQRDMQILPPDARTMMLEKYGSKYPLNKVCAEGDAMLVQALVDQYFDDCADKLTPATVTGLLLALGIYWDGWAELRKMNHPYARVLKNAHLRIAQQFEQKLLGNTTPVGAIYWLKNNTPWKDQDAAAPILSVNFTLKRPDDLPPLEPTIRADAREID